MSSSLSSKATLASVVACFVMRVAHAEPASLDQVPWPATSTLTEHGTIGNYYRQSPSVRMIGVRPSLKAVMRTKADRPDVDLGFDAHLIGRLGLGRGRSLGLWPEMGYVYSGAAGHFASIGLGVASQSPTLESSVWSGLSFGIVPHLLLGLDDRTSRGLRTSAIAELYLDDGSAWGVELAHQITTDGTTTEQQWAIGITLALRGKRW